MDNGEQNIARWSTCKCARAALAHTLLFLFFTIQSKEETTVRGRKIQRVTNDSPGETKHPAAYGYLLGVRPA